MKQHSILALAAILGALAVGLGAFGAHGLRDMVSSADLEIWNTAVRYQAWHALALVLLGVVTSRAGCTDRGALIGWAFLVGSLLFSGSIYGLALDGPGAVLGPITPLGGLCLIIGWGALGWSAFRADGKPA